MLEQETFKLRNDLLKFELEREKLATELEEERKLHKETDEHVKKQQINSENLSNLANMTESDGKLPTQTRDQEDAFRTPSYRAAPTAFVFRRSNYSAISNSSCSPFPDTLIDVADEDAWMKLNNGYVADLDSINFTPAIKVKSVSSNAIVPDLLNKQQGQHQEVEDLRKQLELATKENLRLENWS